MVSPELLRRYPFFANLSDTQLKEIAMLAEEESFAKGDNILQENQPALYLCLLLEGSADLIYASRGAQNKEFTIGQVNSGEIFGMSALIMPHQLTATVRSSTPGRLLKIHATKLRELCDNDCSMGYILVSHIAQVAMERLYYTRVQLAAAWA
jgi:CRP-like cAMP-binding protein